MSAAAARRAWLRSFLLEHFDFSAPRSEVLLAGAAAGFTARPATWRTDLREIGGRSAFFTRRTPEILWYAPGY